MANDNIINDIYCTGDTVNDIVVDEGGIRRYH